MYFVFFFFSSRRRHTRWNCDWSSDVCSSDLHGIEPCSIWQRVDDTRDLRGSDSYSGKIGRASCRKSVDLGGRRIIKKKKRKKKEKKKKKKKNKKKKKKKKKNRVKKK